MNAVTPPVVDRSSDVKTGTASFNNQGAVGGVTAIWSGDVESVPH